MRISDWSSDVCSSDLLGASILAACAALAGLAHGCPPRAAPNPHGPPPAWGWAADATCRARPRGGLHLKGRNASGGAGTEGPACGTPGRAQKGAPLTRATAGDRKSAV